MPVAGCHGGCEPLGSLGALASMEVVFSITSAGFYERLMKMLAWMSNVSLAL